MRQIAIISHKFPPVNSGYGNQALAVLKKIIVSSNDLSFDILTAKYHIKECYETDNRIRINYLWHRLISANTEQISFINYSIFQVHAFFWLLLHFRHYELIHCLASGPHYALAVIAGKLLKKKVILKITNERFFKIEEYFLSDASFIKQNYVQKKNIMLNTWQIWFKNQFRKMLRYFNFYLLKIILLSDIIIVLNSSIMLQLDQHNISSKKIFKIPNGVDDKVYFPAKSKQEIDYIRCKLNLESNSLVILYAGSISYIKGIQDLIEAIRSIKPKQNVTIILCGEDGGYGLILKKSLAEINRLNNLKAIYQGKVDNLAEYYRAADIFVLPSYIEGLPNVLLEAAMSGLPLVASNIGGNKDIIEKGCCGILFPPGNIELLKQALQQLIEDKKLRSKLGNKARHFAFENYRLSSIAEQYIQLYRTL